MAYEITYKQSVQKDIKHLPKEKLRKIYEMIEIQLASNPYAHQKLTGQFAGFYKLVVWPYRVIYEISSTQVTILRIRHRKESYRR